MFVPSGHFTLRALQRVGRNISSVLIKKADFLVLEVWPEGKALGLPYINGLQKHPQGIWPGRHHISTLLALPQLTDISHKGAYTIYKFKIFATLTQGIISRCLGMEKSTGFTVRDT